ncbi:MAG: AmmeMemoRadiSam system protein B [Candidatus Kapaibacteriota bacterium]
MHLPARLPALREAIDVTVYRDNDAEEPYLILSDASGVADGPVMIHADMVAILELCDGETTWDEFANNLGVPTDGPEILQIRSFLAQLDDLGFMDSEQGRRREQAKREAWDRAMVRPPVCSGQTYPDTPDELREFLEGMRAQPVVTTSQVSTPSVVLMPHLDFRVAPAVYAPAMNVLAQSEAELFVIIGTSHYWANDPIIVTAKDFETPIGIVQTDRALAQRLQQIPGAAATDAAHQPEHSIELHAVILQHLHGHRPFSILPILVTGTETEQLDNLSRIAGHIGELVSETGKKAQYLISGDFSHVGLKFGDVVPATMLIDEVAQADQRLIAALEQGAPGTFHELIEGVDYRYRVCGHAPTMLALKAVGVSRGQLLAYETWHEQETQSAVTCATMVFL